MIFLVIPGLFLPEEAHIQGVTGRKDRKERKSRIYTFDQRKREIDKVVVLVQRCFLWRDSLPF